jgi:hypothetical protein
MRWIGQDRNEACIHPRGRPSGALVRQQTGGQLLALLRLPGGAPDLRWAKCMTMPARVLDRSRRPELWQYFLTYGLMDISSDETQKPRLPSDTPRAVARPWWRTQPMRARSIRRIPAVGLGFDRTAARAACGLLQCTCSTPGSQKTRYQGRPG